MYVNFDPCSVTAPYIAAIAGMSGYKGVGCVECGGTCGGMSGLTMDGTGLFGTGIFGDSVTLTDLSTWTWAEVGTIAAAAFVLYSVTSTTRRGVRGVRRVTRRKTRRIKRPAVKGFIGETKR